MLHQLKMRILFYLMVCFNRDTIISNLLYHNIYYIINGFLFVDVLCAQLDKIRMLSE